MSFAGNVQEAENKYSVRPPGPRCKMHSRFSRTFEVDMGGSLDHLRNEPCSHGSPSFPDVESLTRFDRHGVVKFTNHLDVVTWHYHF